MNDDTPYCPLCPEGRDRIPNRPPVCDACRTWLPTMLGDIRIHCEELTADPEPVPDVRGLPVLNPDGGQVPLRDPVILTLPAAPIPAFPKWSATRRVPESHPPMDLGPVDLTGPARQGSHGPQVRGVLGDPDQDGWLSVATMLETWVVDFTVARDLGEHRPQPTVAVMTRWLVDRCDWACDTYPLVAEFAGEVRRYRSVLLATLGLRDLPVRKPVPCPRCDLLTLVVCPGSEWIECGHCDVLLSIDEYHQWTVTVLDSTPRVA